MSKKGIIRGMFSRNLTSALVFVLTVAFCLGLPSIASAQNLSSPSANLESSTASDSATLSGQTATAAAITDPRLTERQQRDITETTSTQKDELTAYLEAQPLAPLTFTNFIQHAIRGAVSQGLPANIVVLLLAFPIIASIIAASRHLIGLQGFGIYIPAVLSIAFVSTGITTGVIIFTTVLLAATAARSLLKRLKLQYLPRTAMLLWGVSLAVLALLLGAANFGFFSLFTVNIFPILIIILLTENFMETQLTSSQSQAVQLTIETLIIAVLCSLLISLEAVQQVVLIRPELTLAAVAVFNIIVGRYSGLRLLEYFRFRSLFE